ncbi:hypothetical protein ECIV_ORF25 [European chub iridovirus]|nr:hypothetical protein ECIV_ORF25 [European chub iridovirus]
MEPLCVLCISVLVGLMYKFILNHVDALVPVLKIIRTVILLNMPKCVRNFFVKGYMYSEAKRITDNTVQISFNDDDMVVRGTVLLMHEKKPFRLTDNDNVDVTYKYKHFYDWEQILPSSGITVNYDISSNEESDTTK